MAPRFRLDSELVSLLRDQLPSVATHTVSAVRAEVPAYSRDFGGELGAVIEQAVQVALSGFLRLAAQGKIGEGGGPLSPAIEGAYALGRGEARSGRSVEHLLAAYRVGARVSWRELASRAVESGVPAGTISDFAELVFAYIDELSAASVAGHTDELATSGRVRERYVERLVHALLAGAPEAELEERASAADWVPPQTLTPVVLPESQARSSLTGLDERTLAPVERPADLPVDDGPGLTVLLVPDVAARSRARFVRSFAGRDAVVGPPRPWHQVRPAYLRALRCLAVERTEGRPVDTEEELVRLVLTADPDALADLRTRALAPLDGLRASSRAKLAETLRSWLLHQGRRDDVAADLFVHPQTVRYRMGQLREVYGDGLDDPRTVLELVLALSAEP